MDLVMDILKERLTTSAIFDITRDDLYGLGIPGIEA